jgi:hypothetical protein
MRQQKCRGDHRTHLCALAGNKRIREIERLVTNPRYICANCGRAADSQKHVCNAKPLHDSEETENA